MVFPYGMYVSYTILFLSTMQKLLCKFSNMVVQNDFTVIFEF